MLHFKLHRSILWFTEWTTLDCVKFNIIHIDLISYNQTSEIVSTLWDNSRIEDKMVHISYFSLSFDCLLFLYSLFGNSLSSYLDCDE